MKKALFLLPLLAATGALSTRARADVSWEHRGSVKVGKSPLVTFAMKNTWSGQKHRVAFDFDATKAFATMAPSNTKPVNLQTQLIERLDDDRLIFSSTQNKTYVDEPYRSLKSRFRLNVWEALGSNLSADNVPQLTPEQRERLGQELRAVISPVTRKVTRYYFRALPETRVIKGLTTRGYRVTSLVNIGGRNPEWMRVSAEWWLADYQRGDDEILAFTQSANDLKAASGGNTASMWLNETLPVLWEAAPVESHQALESLIGKPGDANYGYRGTPVQFFMTIAPPPAAEMSMGGPVRVSLELARRSNDNVNTEIFDAPTGYKRIEIEPFLGMARNFIKMSRARIDAMMNQ